MSQSFASDLTGRAIVLANRLNVTYWAILGLARLVRALPLRVSYGLATAVADVVFGLWRGIRARTTENMRWVVGPELAVVLAREAFRHYFRYLVEFLRDDLADRVEIRGVENLHRAVAEGKGVVAIGFHIGNIDLGAAVLAQVGYPVTVVVDTFSPPRLDALIQGQRAEKGLKLVALQDAPRQALKALRRNEIVALLIDKPTPLDGVVVRFFGGEISIPGGAAVLALRTGAAVVPCCVFRRPGGRFVAEVAPPVDPSAIATGDGKRDVQALTQRMVETLEGWVRRHPEQWYPFRRMWLAAG